MPKKALIEAIRILHSDCREILQDGGCVTDPLEQHGGTIYDWDEVSGEYWEPLYNFSDPFIQVDSKGVVHWLHPDLMSTLADYARREASTDGKPLDQAVRARVDAEMKEMDNRQARSLRLMKMVLGYPPFASFADVASTIEHLAMSTGIETDLAWKLAAVAVDAWADEPKEIVSDMFGHITRALVLRRLVAPGVRTQPGEAEVVAAKIKLEIFTRDGVVATPGETYPWSAIHILASTDASLSQAPSGLDTLLARFDQDTYQIDRFDRPLRIKALQDLASQLSCAPASNHRLLPCLSSLNAFLARRDAGNPVTASELRQAIAEDEEIPF